MVMNTPLRPIITCMERYILYETSSYYYIVGCDAMETYFRVLKLNRTVVKPRSLDEVLTEDPIVYTKDDLRLVLEMIHEGNKTSGGLSRVTVAYGIVGFVRFLDCYYVTLITQKKKVGCVGSNFIYAIKAAEVFAIRPQENSKDELSITKMWRSVNKKLTKTNTDQAESRYMGLFQFIDISKDFFFSYTYDLTHSLQHNYIMSGTNTFPPPPFKEMYEWNKYQTDEIRACLGDVSASLWSLPIIHGSFQQRRFSMFGRTLDLVLIARRSRHYAGTRYLKRGVSVHGKVANDCEMEQIVQLDSGLQATFASYVQMRGSIPTYWYQETSVTNPKPPILVDRFDPNYLATQEHFADLIRRYSLPVIVLDLVKQHERRKRECIVGKDFRQAIDVINISMPPEQQIRYIALDFSRMSKSKGAAPGRDSKGAATGKEWSRIESSLGKEVEQSMRRAESGPMMSAPNDNRDSEGEEPPVKDQQTGGEALVGRVDVLRELEEISSWSLQETAIFSSTIKHRGRLSEIMPERHLDRAAELGYIEQRGVLRTNCIDCLDRTNVAQFAMGVRFLTTALTALGVLDSHTLEPSNAMLLGLMDMYSDMGDRLALQYGGSEAHKKVSKGAGKTKHGEFLTSIKRYYSNSFTDRVKQDAMNLFLGYFQPSVHEYALWDLETDYFLHNRLLHPPRPDTDLILFSSCRGEHMSESDTEDAPRRSSLGDRPTIEEIIYSGCLQRPPPEDSDDMDDIDWSKVSRKYFIKHPEDANKIERNIASKERIKRRLSEKKELVKAAEELWWRKALMDFDSERMWMRLPPKKDGMSTLSYYETTHTPLKLTSFDDELSQEFQYPMDATVFAAPKPEAVGYWTRGRDVGKMTIQEGREDDGDDEEGQMEAEGEGRRIDQVEFDLFSFARSLGQRARSLVGDLLKPVESEGAVLKSSLSDSDLKRERSPMTWASRANDAGGLQARPSDECAERLYTRYCEDGIHPESYISESRCMSEKDFEHALAGVMVDDNDVQAMEQLAKDSYISDTVSSGPYRGLNCNESAKMAFGAIQSSLVFIEPCLERCIYSDSPEDSGPVEVVPEIQKAKLTRQASFRSMASVEMPTVAKQKVEKILHASAYSSVSSVEEEVLHAASRYLYGQVLYSREVDEERITKRLSSLTSEGDILDYTSLYDREVVAAEMDDITFMATDRASSKSFQHLENEFSRLKKLKRSMDESKKLVLKCMADMSGDGVTESSTSLDLAQQTPDSAASSRSTAAGHVEYPGFTQIGPDLFMKASNPHFVCNERTVASYSQYRRRTAAS